jgi:hypothetical protein
LFARKIFGSVDNAMGRYFKMEDGTRVQVVGIVEDGKYYQLTEDPKPAMFLPFLQIAHQPDMPGGALRIAIRSNWPAPSGTTLQDLDAGLPLEHPNVDQGLDIALFPSHVATVALGVLGMMGAMLAITGIFGMAAFSVSKRLRELGIRMALGAQRKEVLRAALGRPVKLLALVRRQGLLLGILAPACWAHCLYGNSARSAGPGRCSLAMSLLGLLATWIPAQRALSVNPLILLREE